MGRHWKYRFQTGTGLYTHSNANYLELVYFVTALVPSETACLANSPGNNSLTAVWISREVMVDLFQNLVDVDGVRILPLPLLLFLLALGHSLGSLARLDGGLPRGLRRHGIGYEQ